MDIKRTVVISADDSEFSASVDRMGRALSGAFDRANDSINKAENSVGSIADKVKSKFADLEQKASSNFKNILKDSDKYTKSVSDRVRFMEREVRTMERLAKEERDRSRLQAKTTYEQRLTSARGEKGDKYQDLVYSAEKDYKEALKIAEEKYGRSKVEVGAVRSKVSDYAYNNKDKIDREDEQKERSIANRGVGIGRVAIGSALGAAGYDFVTSIGGWIGKFISEGMALDTSIGKFSGLSKPGKSVGVYDGTRYGLKEADMISYTRNVALGLGTTKGVGSEAVRELGMETGFGLEHGQVGALNKTLRASSRSERAADATIEMLNIFKKGNVFGIKQGDFTQVAEKLSDLSQQNDTQASQREAIDSRFSSQLMSAFGNIGGSFKDFRQGSTISNINQSITNPSNDFKKAFIFRALRDTMPNANLFDVMKKQESGIYGEGTLDAIMKRAVKTSSGENLKFNVSRLLELNLSQGEVFTNKYLQNPDILRGIKSKTDIDNITKEAIMGGGEVGTVNKFRATTDQMLGRAGRKVIKKVEPYITAAMKFVAGDEETMYEKLDREKREESEKRQKQAFEKIRINVSKKVGLTPEQKKKEELDQQVKYLEDQQKGIGANTLSKTYMGKTVNPYSIDPELFRSINEHLRSIDKNTSLSTDSLLNLTNSDNAENVFKVPSN